MEYCQEKILELYKPKSYIFMNYTEVKDKICQDYQKYYSRKRPETSVENTISAFFNVKMCDERFENPDDIYAKIDMSFNVW